MCKMTVKEGIHPIHRREKECELKVYGPCSPTTIMLCNTKPNLVVETHSDWSFFPPKMLHNCCFKRKKGGHLYNLSISCCTLSLLYRFGRVCFQIYDIRKELRFNFWFFKSTLQTLNSHYLYLFMKSCNVPLEICCAI